MPEDLWTSFEAIELESFVRASQLVVCFVVPECRSKSCKATQLETREVSVNFWKAPLFLWKGCDMDGIGDKEAV